LQDAAKVELNQFLLSRYFFQAARKSTKSIKRACELEDATQIKL
jgi:hypothetical protein